MAISFDLPGRIPVFPLPGAVLLPRAQMPLHLFEPRYLAMLEDCMKTPDRLIGMIQPYEDGKRLHSIGCAGRMTAFSETEDGRYMITLSGVSRFRVQSEEKEGFTPYRRCNVTWTGFEQDLGPTETDPAMNRDEFLGVLERFFQEADLQTDWEGLQEADDELLINSLSMLCPFSPEDKQALLEAPSLSTRRETLVTLIQFALRGGMDKDFMQ